MAAFKNTMTTTLMLEQNLINQLLNLSCFCSDWTIECYFTLRIVFLNTARNMKPVIVARVTHNLTAHSIKVGAVVRGHIGYL